MAVLDTLETRYSANIIQFEREVARMAKISRKQSDAIAADQSRAAKGAKTAWEKADIGSALNKSLATGITGVSAQLAKLAPMLAAAFAGNAAIGAMDTYSRFTNQLKIANLAGSQLAAVQEHLYQSALKNGSALEPLGTLYARISQNAKELGASQSDILKITDSVAASIRTSGGTAEQSAGALMQLGQAFGSGTVHAEEFNSVNEGLPTLLKAAAEASEKYGGSVAKMKADVVKGGLSSQEFARLIQAANKALEESAASASLTVGQAMTNIQTALVKSIGAVDQTYGVTTTLTNAMTYLSKNLDLVAKSLMVLAAIYTASAIPAIGGAALALGRYSVATIGAGVNSVRLAGFQVAMTASMRGTTVAAESAAMAMRGLMSATGVGLAIVAITGALALFAANSLKAAEAEREFQARLDAGNAARANAKKAADQARVATGDLTKKEMDALVHTASLTDQANKLADARYRVAAATKAQIIQESLAAVRQAGADTVAAKKKLSQSTVGRSFSTNLNSPGLSAPQGPVKDNDAVTKARANVASAEANEAEAAAKYYKNLNSKLETYLPDKPKPAVTKPDKGAAGREKAGDSLIESAESDLRNATKGLAVTVEERHAANLVSLQDELDQHNRVIKEKVKDGSIDEADAKIATAKFKEANEAKVKAENASYQRELDDRLRELTSRDLETTLERLRIEEDELTSLGDHAKTTKEKQAYEASALAKRQEADRLSFAAQQEQLRLDLQKLGLTKAEIDQRIATKQAVFNQGQANERTAQVTDQSKATPSWGGFMESLGTSADSLNTKLQNIAGDGLGSLVDGLASAAVGSGSLKDAFADTVKSMIANLIKLGIQFLVFEAIGMAFGVPGLGKAAIGLNKHATGTNFAPGGLSLVGENGPELVGMPRGAQVVPNNLLKNAFNTPKGVGAAGGQTLHFNTVINADNAVMRADIDRMVFEAQTKTYQAVMQANPKQNARIAGNRLG